jgi:hypothetical protein
MTYKTSDIIKRARQLADLENSDFISYEENLMLINECYNKLYEKLINHNDKAFIKSVNLTGFSAGENKTVYELPADFWQLYGVRASVSNIPIPRKAQSESDTTNSYDIENDNLVIYGNRIADTLILDYWQRPPMLTYPRKAQRLDLPKIFSAYNDKAIIYDSDNLTYKLVDLDGNLIFDFNVNSNFMSVVGKNAAAIMYIGLGLPYTIDIYRKGIQTQDTTVYSAWVNHGVIYYAKYTDPTAAEIYTQNNVLAYTAHLPAGISRFLFAGKDFVLAEVSGALKAYYLDDTGATVETVETDIKARANFPILYEGDNIYFIDADDNITCYDMSAREFYTINDDYDAECLAWQGENSGYGYINSSGALCSFYPDTVLDFTHNFYFTLLAYYLAIAYKAKQNADSTALQQLAAEAEEHFYDTIGRDAYNVTRIRNHYA